MVRCVSFFCFPPVPSWLRPFSDLVPGDSGLWNWDLVFSRFFLKRTEFSRKRGVVLFRFCCKFAFALGRVFDGNLSRGARDIWIGTLLFAVAHIKPAKVAAGAEGLFSGSVPVQAWNLLSMVGNFWIWSPWLCRSEPNHFPLCFFKRNTQGW